VSLSLSPSDEAIAAGEKSRASNERLRALQRKREEGSQNGSITERVQCNIGGAPMGVDERKGNERRTEWVEPASQSSMENLSSELVCFLCTLVCVQQFADFRAVCRHFLAMEGRRALLCP